MKPGEVQHKIREAAHCADRFKTIAFAHLDRPIPEFLAAALLELKSALASLTEDERA